MPVIPSTPKQFCYASWTAWSLTYRKNCERVNDILLKAGATDVRLAQDEAERVRFWAGQKCIYRRSGRISPDYYCMDGTIPRRALPGVLEGIARLSQQYDLRVPTSFMPEMATCTR